MLLNKETKPISKSKEKLATRRLPFQGVWEGATPFPGLLQFTLDRYLISLSIKQGDIKYHFKVFGWTIGELQY